MFLLWHPSLTAINLSYTSPILETSATALCGTTGIWLIFLRWVETPSIRCWNGWSLPDATSEKWITGVGIFSSPFKVDREKTHPRPHLRNLRVFLHKKGLLGPVLHLGQGMFVLKGCFMFYVWHGRTAKWIGRIWQETLIGTGTG